MRFILLLMISVFNLIPMTSSADTHQAASCSAADVTAAYNEASDGDIIDIPAGNCSWSSGLTIAKALTINGAGKTQTVITHNSMEPTIDIKLNYDAPIRVTGIGFNKVNSTNTFAIKYVRNWTESSAVTQLRIDHCKFTNGSEQIKISGWINGIIENNEFLNGHMAIRTYGDNDNSWERTIAAGTANALFIEDNTFTINGDVDWQISHQIYHSYGSRTVVRYNTFDQTTYTEGITAFLDSHGNQNYYNGSNDFRGQPILEIYGNKFWGYNVPAGAFQFRSGSVLIYNNDFKKSTGSGLVPFFYEEEAYVIDFFNPLATEWAAEDNVTNTFIWGNTCNWSNTTCDGTNIVDIYVSEPSTTFIQKNRDYFMHVPESFGGKSFYPIRAGASDMTFNSSVANAYYPYTPYSYPHPLRKPSAPQNWKFSP